MDYALPSLSDICSNACMTTPTRPQLWSVWSDYFATGEGRTLMAVVGYASSEEQAKALFVQQFGEWFALGCEAAPGVVPNPVLEHLFSPVVLQLLTDNDGVANLKAHASVHINMS